MGRRREDRKKAVTQAQEERLTEGEKVGTEPAEVQILFFSFPRHIDSLRLPKFSISGDYNLKNILPLLGIREVFTKEADLSGITGAKNLVLSQVVHKAVLDVAEEGTEAAAATGIKMVPMSGRMDPMLTLNFNFPFLLILQDKDLDNILFMGRIREL
ncbi:PREDICTED: serine protease inhibitor A3N-like [Propithecus coquereli]|uniref:serine protease inhibitor A3N-like n=1 Tax=Propithecus coquereli TaxID=379532 RepID=UPI00063F6BCF|nr:PREDICTED: serine protease inhibitor A3N-like [Propithecus coquereli]